MKNGFYSRIALEGIKNNKRLYIPYLVTCCLMVSVFYILAYLTDSGVLDGMSGGSSMTFILKLGSFVIAVFSAIFLFYTNSFLIRKRKKEFGLYNVLGMDKRNIGKILIREILITYIVSLAVGLISGFGLSVISKDFLIKLIDGKTVFELTVPTKAIVYTIVFFAAIFFIIFLNANRQIRKSNAVNLVKSENTGEKPPKSNAVLGITGVVLLGGAYWLSVEIQNPIDALIYFFVAVIMVIIGTYLLMIAGSVMMCRILQKSRKYYYKPRNFVSVSSMVYRMKRNGAGLASICIILTMVLVMISSSACLYFGKDVALTSRYPREICAFASWYGYSEENDLLADRLSDMAEEFTESEGMEISNLMDYTEYCITGLYKDGNVSVELNSESDLSFIKYSDIVQVHFIELEDYNRLFSQNETLNDGEALICAVKTDVGESFRVGDIGLKVKDRIDQRAIDFDGSSQAAVTANVFAVVNNIDAYAHELEKYKDYNGDPMLLLRWYYQFDTELTNEEQSESGSRLESYVTRNISYGDDIDSFIMYVNCRNHEKADFLETFGGLFFIGIMLSIVFLISAALIIYYKQISEGYEDQSRFEIMQNVGMTKEDIRRSINSQLLMVFTLPIAFAMMHIGFAFPFIQKLLMLFGIFHTPLLIATTGVSVLACTLFYIIVYRLTSNAYYSIVTGAKNNK